MGCDSTSPTSNATYDASVDLEPYLWSLPKGVPLPMIPEDNPMSEAKVSSLGARRRLDVAQDALC